MPLESSSSSDALASRALFAATRSGDIAAVRRLLAAGANPRASDGRETPLHVAARRGPAALVAALIEGGALEWVGDAQGRTPLEVARRNRPRERAAIVALLDRAKITDRSFRAAVAAIASGDVTRLARLIDAAPRLLRERFLGPQAYRNATRSDYFRDPKLFWFLANNPNRVARMPENLIEVARVMLERGVDASDLDYTLELTASSGGLREPPLQGALLRLLLEAGAVATPGAIAMTAGHRELDALRVFLETGTPLDAPIAAALSENERLRALLGNARAADVQLAFGLACINRNLAGMRLALDAGADPNARLPVHAHATPLHQAALDDDPDMIAYLLERGADPDVRDTLWDATPLGWAHHQGRSRAISALVANSPA